MCVGGGGGVGGHRADLRVPGDSNGLVGRHLSFSGNISRSEYVLRYFPEPTAHTVQ